MCKYQVSGDVVCRGVYTGMLKGFRVFLSFLVYQRVGFRSRPIFFQFAKLGAFWKIGQKKLPICSKLGAFYSNLFGIVMGRKITLFEV